MLKIYNTLTGKKENFLGENGKAVQFFVCGPTVYESAHLGHARTYIAFDAIVKYLKEKWFDVFYLQNITDIDDKIIQRAKEKKITTKKLSQHYEKKYQKDMKALKVNSVTKYARATDYVKEIVTQIKKLNEKGFAYQIADGLYYDIKKFKNYGQLSGRTILQAEDAISRIDESKEKRNKGDFCLWKFSKKEEPKWPSPWGEGRPGWHIEDTAITEKFFGSQYDVHAGAKDLIFPHHEAEIAQMEAISGQAPMVKYWLHSGFLTVKGKKMAKSLNNFITIQDFLKIHSPRILRLIILEHHYRSPLDYKDDLLIQAEKEIERVDDFLRRLKQVDHKKEKNRHLVLEAEREFEKAMEDDFNTPRAMAALFNLITRANSMIDQDALTGADVKSILQFLKKFDRVFNFIFWPQKEKKIPREIIILAKQREKYRKSKEWQQADQIRQKIKTLGWQVKDTEKGPELKII
ncbi:MAG: cysteine--tRNA ligase [Candidatus Nealsonbacteria bacterium]